MEPLRKNATLRDIQNYIKEWEIENGFSDCDLRDSCLFLGEEFGELFKAIRKLLLKVDPNSDSFEIADEIADCLMQLAAIANRCNIDMDEAIQNKEKKNAGRKWVKVN
jgi:NTP pyrophosphatase (non-canonical NTP hydrolase)